MFEILFLLFVDPEVVMLIEKMGDRKFTARQQATSSLQKMDERPIPLLLIASSSHKDAEVRKRATSLVDEALAKLKPSNGKSVPLITCLPDNYPDRSNVIDKYLKPYTIYPYQSYSEEYQAATVDLVEDLFKAGMTRKEIVRLLDEMVEINEQYEPMGRAR